MSGSDWLEALTLAAQKEVSGKGYKVYVKSNLGPAIKVYDAREPAAESGGDGLLKFGVYIVDGDGDEKMGFGGKPETNKLLMASVVAIAATVAILLIRGAVRK